MEALAVSNSVKKYYISSPVIHYKFEIKPFIVHNSLWFNISLFVKNKMTIDVSGAASYHTYVLKPETSCAVLCYYDTICDINARRRNNCPAESNQRI